MFERYCYASLTDPQSNKEVEVYVALSAHSPKEEDLFIDESTPEFEEISEEEYNGFLADPNVFAAVIYPEHEEEWEIALYDDVPDVDAFLENVIVMESGNNWEILGPGERNRF